MFSPWTHGVREAPSRSSDLATRSRDVARRVWQRTTNGTKADSQDVHARLAVNTCLHVFPTTVNSALRRSGVACINTTSLAAFGMMRLPRLRRSCARSIVPTTPTSVAVAPLKSSRAIRTSPPLRRP
eukprot:scaffold4223_cov189-Amphora_coffeaeformis.AAC.39